LEGFIDGLRCLRLVHRPFIANASLQIPITQLSDDVAIVGASEDLVATQDIGMTECLDNFYLRVEKIEKCGCLDAAHLYHLDGYGLIYG